MKREQVIKILKRIIEVADTSDCGIKEIDGIDEEALNRAIELLENIASLGEDMRICQQSITDDRVLIGFNMAVAICNKYLSESENTK